MKTTRIAALGDSITKGVVLNDQNRYSAAEQSFLDILSSELDLRVDNYGKFGCTVSHGNSVLERHAADIADSDYTFIEYGGNDCDFDWIKIAQDPHGEHKARTPLEEFTEELSSLVTKVKGLGSIPVLITLPPILSETYFSYISRSMSDEQKNNIKEWLGGDVGIITRWHESYNRGLFQVANQTRTQILDITTPFDTFKGDLTSLYCADGIHPNAHGHKLIAHTIINMYL